MSLPDNKLAPGSYRDPSGFVFFDEGGVYRAISRDTWPLVETVLASGLAGEDGGLVPAERIQPGSPQFARFRERFPDYEYFVRHPRMDPLSFPYEWCFSMVADAGLLHLELQKSLLGMGFSLKDATAYNVQFEPGGRPVFIDLTSVEKPGRLDVWIAYGQFCRMFLYPLLLQLHKGLRPRQLFVADIEGVDVELAANLLGLGALKPDCFFDVYLQSCLNRMNAGKARKLGSSIKQQGGSANVQLFNIERLSRKLQKLKGRYRLGGPWADYAVNNTYSAEAQSEKAAFIQRFLEKNKPATVLDVGCNTGTYSRLAAASGARVIAVDSDHDCIESLYRVARRERLAILPLVVDITNPSPALGFMNREREGFLQRVRGDAVFALALMHHLLVSARIPLAGIRDLFHAIATRDLVIEFVPHDDQMFQTLLALREDLYGALSLDQFIAVFREKFDVVEQQPMAGSGRVLLALRKRESSST